MADEKDINVFTDEEKQRFLTHLSNVGETKPDNWVLIHSEICGPDEENFDVSGLIDDLKKNEEYTKFSKFAIDIVSNPNEGSSLDRGVVKVRYRYVLHPSHAGEAEIKSNTREFCEAIIRADKIYRREDINIMSFRGVNPIAKSNYSIFNLKGHWNCRHAWAREVYLVTDPSANVEDSRIVDKKTVMKKKSFFARLKLAWAALAASGEEFTKEDLVELNKTLFAEIKFVDEKVGDKTLRIEGEEPKEGAVVAWVDADGNMMDVEPGEYVIDGKDKVVVVGEGSTITEVKDKPADGGGDGNDTMMSKEQLTEVIGEVIDKKFEEFKKNQKPEDKEETEEEKQKREKTEKEVFQKAVQEGIEKVMSDMPAFAQDQIAMHFRVPDANKGGSGEPRSRLEKVLMNKGKKEE